MQMQFTIDFDYKRCIECGRFFYFEKGTLQPNSCAICLMQSNNAAFERHRERQAEQDRTISALRGVITKLKRRK